jgi:hypothetical protein
MAPACVGVDTWYGCALATGRVEAQPTIERFLSNQALGERMGREVAKLREAASIEYYPPYSPPD